MQCSRLCMVRAGTSFPTWDIFTFSKHNNSTFDLFLFQYDWYTKKTTLVLDVVNRSAEGEKYQLLTPQMHLLIQDILNLFISVIWQMALLVSTALSCLPSVGQLTVSVSSLLLLRGAAKYCILSTIIYPSLSTDNWGYSLWSYCFLKELLMVDINTGSVTNLTSSESYLCSYLGHLMPNVVFRVWWCSLSSESEVGNWSLLNMEKDLMVVSCSSPNCPPSLVGFSFHSFLEMLL